MNDLLLKPQPGLTDLRHYVRGSLQERGFRADADFMPQQFMLLMKECGEFVRAVRKQRE